MFPFHKVKKDAKIVLWGLGTVGKEYIAQILAINYCHIEFIIDSNFKNKEYKGISVYFPQKILKQNDKTIQYVISIFSQKTAEDIKKQLLQLGISENQIIYDSRLCKFTQCTADIIEGYNPWNEEIGYVQDSFIRSGYYISGIPFKVKHEIKAEYEQIKKMFCNSNGIVNNLDQTRLHFLWQNIENVLSRTKGNVAEVGVYQGATAVILQKYCIKYGRKLYLFDTFEGFNKTDIVGIDEEKNQNEFKDTSLEFVKNKLENDANTKIKRGYFPESIDQECETELYSFVHVDCDLYKPIIESLNFFWPRLEMGGMIAVHDYSSGFWLGASQAVDEFCEKNNISKIFIPDWSGTVVLSKNYYG